MNVSIDEIIRFSLRPLQADNGRLQNGFESEEMQAKNNSILISEDVIGFCLKKSCIMIFLNE